ARAESRRPEILGSAQRQTAHELRAREPAGRPSEATHEHLVPRERAETGEVERVRTKPALGVRLREQALGRADALRLCLYLLRGGLRADALREQQRKRPLEGAPLAARREGCRPGLGAPWREIPFEDLPEARPLEARDLPEPRRAMLSVPPHPLE